jgi:hypothetical protein
MDSALEYVLTDARGLLLLCPFVPSAAPTAMSLCAKRLSPLLPEAQSR